MLSVVVDTSVFVRGLLASPVNRNIILALKASKYVLIISDELFDELLDVVARPKFRNVFIPEAVDELMEIIKIQAKFVKPTQKVSICRDAEDQKVLECALGGADVIVSNDKDLLILNPFRHIKILPPTEFLNLLSKS